MFFGRRNRPAQAPRLSRAGVYGLIATAVLSLSAGIGLVVISNMDISNDGGNVDKLEQDVDYSGVGGGLIGIGAILACTGAIVECCLREKEHRNRIRAVVQQPSNRRSILEEDFEQIEQGLRQGVDPLDLDLPGRNMQP